MLPPYAIANYACKKANWLFASGDNIAIGTAIRPILDENGFFDWAEFS
jgi:hypothetical protein